MEADGDSVEIVQRRESEEVEDIESSSDIASEDEHKEEQSPTATKVDDVADDGEESVQSDLPFAPESNECDGKPKDDEDQINESSESENVQSSNRRDKNDKHGKDLDIEGELDYEEEVQGKDDESDGEHEDEDGEVEPESRAQEKEEGEEDDEDDGELSDDDLEEGEVKDSSSPRKSQPKSICRFFHKGQCTWGLNCRFIHPGVNDKGNYNMFSPPPKSSSASHNSDQHSSFQSAHPEVDHFPPPPPPPPPPIPREEPPPPESAWERGLRHAKEIIKKAMKRKESETDFEEKRMNMSLVESELQSEYEKEADYYATQQRHRSENESYYQYSMYEEAALRNAYDRRAYAGGGGGGAWHNSRTHENYDMQWSHVASAEYDFRDYRDRNRHYQAYERDNREGKENRERIDHRNQERWRDDRYTQVQSNRATRGDEWRDPWRRSKSPKGSRRSRSKGRSRRSYSSASSASYSSSRSSRSRSSSYSYSKSRSSSRSSRSRSYSFSPVRSKSKTPEDRSKLYSKPINSSQSSNKKHSTSGANTHKTVNNNKHKAKSPVPAVAAQRPKRKPRPTVPSPAPAVAKQKPSQPAKSTRTQHSPSWSASLSSRSRSPPLNRYRSGSRSLSISSVSSVSSSLGSLSGDEFTPKKKIQAQDKGRPKVPKEKVNRQMPRERPKRPVEDNAKVTAKMSKDPLKQSSGGKPQIKLTLLKPSSDKVNAVSKRKTIDEMLAEKHKLEKAVKSNPKSSTSKKRPASSPLDSQPPAKSSATAKKSTSSRREELLKQLRAVEDAIARKRTKF